MSVYVYVLKSIAFDRRYVGISKDLKERLKRHNAGYTRSTKPYAPWKIIYVEKYENYSEARKREKYLKSAAGRKFLQKTLAP